MFLTGWRNERLSNENKINNENTKIDIAKNNLGIKIARANFLKKVFI